MVADTPHVYAAARLRQSLLEHHPDPPNELRVVADTPHFRAAERRAEW